MAVATTTTTTTTDDDDDGGGDDRRRRSGRRRARSYGYDLDELYRMIDKKDLINALSFDNEFYT